MFQNIFCSYLKYTCLSNKPYDTLKKFSIAPYTINLIIIILEMLHRRGIIGRIQSRLLVMFYLLNWPLLPGAFTPSMAPQVWNIERWMPTCVNSCITNSPRRTTWSSQCSRWMLTLWPPTLWVLFLCRSDGIYSSMSSLNNSLRNFHRICFYFQSYWYRTTEKKPPKGFMSS